jgi:hypothetical protein
MLDGSCVSGGGQAQHVYQGRVALDTQGRDLWIALDTNSQLTPVDSD